MYLFGSPGLSRGIQEDLKLQHVGAITISMTKALTPGTLHWKLRDLATGPPGKSLKGLGAKSPWFLWGLQESVCPHFR